MADQDHKNTKLRSSTMDTNGVIITFYVESPVAAPWQSTHPIKRGRPLQSHGYHRRAELLAYARDLRQGTSDRWPYYNKISRTKHNKRRWSSFPTSFCRMFQGRRRYERLVGEVNEEPRQSRIKGRNEKTRIDVKLCRKLRSIFKEFSCGWRCNNGRL